MKIQRKPENVGLWAIVLRLSELLFTTENTEATEKSTRLAVLCELCGLCGETQLQFISCAKQPCTPKYWHVRHT